MIFPTLSSRLILQTLIQDQGRQIPLRSPGNPIPLPNPDRRGCLMIRVWMMLRAGPHLQVSPMKSRPLSIFRTRPCLWLPVQARILPQRLTSLIRKQTQPQIGSLLILTQTRMRKMTPPNSPKIRVRKLISPDHPGIRPRKPSSPFPPVHPLQEPPTPHLRRSQTVQPMRRQLILWRILHVCPKKTGKDLRPRAIHRHWSWHPPGIPVRQGPDSSSPPRDRPVRKTVSPSPAGRREPRRPSTGKRPEIQKALSAFPQRPPESLRPA